MEEMKWVVGVGWRYEVGWLMEMVGVVGVVKEV